MGKGEGKKGNGKPLGGLPDGFAERLDSMVGPSLAAQARATFVTRPTTLRLNRLKVPVAVDEYGKKQPDQLVQYLQQDGFKLERVPWYVDAYVLRSRTKRELTETPTYLDGNIYIQSLASMAPPLVLEPQPGERVLDLTAAPGSKTSQIAAMMGRRGELVANDNNKVRFFKLKHNMELLGVGNGVPKPEDGDWKFTLRLEHGADLCREYPNYFDKILLDAPCSAEARFVEGDPKTFGYWSERKIKEMAFKQRSLLFAAWGALKPGGVLVYSTCTFAPEENEVQIARLLERFSDVLVEPITVPMPQPLPALKNWKDKEFPAALKNTLRINPTRDIEGFYIAKLRKCA